MSAQTMNSTARLQGSGLVVGYGEHKVLDGVDFSVLEGELTVIPAQMPAANPPCSKPSHVLSRLKVGRCILTGSLSQG